MEENVEGAFEASSKGKAQSNGSFGKRPFGGKKGKEKKEEEGSKGGSGKGKYHPCPHCKKKGHSKNFC